MQTNGCGQQCRSQLLIKHPMFRRTPGVGPKRAAQFRLHGTLDGILDAGRFQTQAAMLRLYRLIATTDANAPLPTLADQKPKWASASSLARRWGLNQLADRLDERVRPP
jgi:hypothetical protein